jgi:hypothetical protein
VEHLKYPFPLVEHLFPLRGIMLLPTEYIFETIFSPDGINVSGHLEYFIFD